MKKHLENDHIREIQQIQGRGEGQGWRGCRMSLFKKWKHVPPLSITDFFGGGTSYFKKNLVQLKIH
jgi:hypothetical protein